MFGITILALFAAAIAYVLATWPMPRADRPVSTQDHVPAESAAPEPADSAAFAPGVPRDASPKSSAHESPPPESAARPSTPVEPESQRRYVHETVNVRAGPGLDKPVLMQLHAGDSVQVLAEAGGWAKVHLASGEEGYIYLSLLKQRPPPG